MMMRVPLLLIVVNQGAINKNGFVFARVKGVPRKDSFNLANLKRTLNSIMAPYYAVRNGRQTGVYTNW